MLLIVQMRLVWVYTLHKPQCNTKSTKTTHCPSAIEDPPNSWMPSPTSRYATSQRLDLAKQKEPPSAQFYVSGG
jgi:hypothetical protein